MRIIKTIKYKLTEETLEKDIESFISEARDGKYDWDYKYGMEGLKIIKEYFRILKEKFKIEEFEECKNCYHKLIVFVLRSATHKDEAVFGYEDLIGRMKLNWDEIIRNYIISLIKTCEIEELTEKISEYAVSLQEYGFDTDTKTLIEELDEQILINLEQRMLIKTEGVMKRYDDKGEILFFLMKLAEEQREKGKYLQCCERFREVLSDEEVDFMIKGYGEREEAEL